MAPGSSRADVMSTAGLVLPGRQGSQDKSCKYGVRGELCIKAQNKLQERKAKTRLGEGQITQNSSSLQLLPFTVTVTGSEFRQGHRGFGVGSGLEAGSVSAHEMVTVSPDLTRAEGWNRTVCGKGRVRDHFHRDSKVRAWGWSAELAAGREQVREDTGLGDRHIPY